MIYDWRLLFRNEKLPFYYVQVAPFRWADANEDTHYAEFREVQSRIRGIVKNSEMALTMDIAEADELHPTNKQDLAYRLSKLAFAKTYGMDSVVCTGPEYLGMSIQDTLVKVRFMKASIGSGLATSDGLAPRHFQLAGDDGVFHPAIAAIKGDEVHLSTPLVPKPRHIRYAFKNDCVTNLGNREGFPAIPFRTDR
jgi:sialate O-acetylesterase